MSRKVKTFEATLTFGQVSRRHVWAETTGTSSHEKDANTTDRPRCPLYGVYGISPWYFKYDLSRLPRRCRPSLSILGGCTPFRNANNCLQTVSGTCNRHHHDWPAKKQQSRGRNHCLVSQLTDRNKGSMSIPIEDAVAGYSTLVRTGLPLDPALSYVENDASDQRGVAIISNIIEFSPSRLKEGMILNDAKWSRSTTGLAHQVHLAVDLNPDLPVEIRVRGRVSPNLGGLSPNNAPELRRDRRTDRRPRGSVSVASHGGRCSDGSFVMGSLHLPNARTRVVIPESDLRGGTTILGLGQELRLGQLTPLEPDDVWW